MKKTMLTMRTLDKFEDEYKTEQYKPEEIEVVEHCAYVANMNEISHPEWTEADIFADFLRCVVDVHHIAVEPIDATIPESELDEAVCEEAQKELDAERREELFHGALSTIWDRQEYQHLRSLGVYDYHDAVLTDVIQYIMDEEPEKDCADRDELEEKLNDELWTVDSVTGNGSGSYTFSRAAAKENVQGNYDLVREMAEEFCVDKADLADHFMDDDWEWFDVGIRCYLLDWAIHYAMDLLNDGLVYGEVA